MTEEARKVLEEINKKRIDDIHNRANNSTIDSITEELLDTIATLGFLIEKKMKDTDDPVVIMGGMGVLEQFPSFMKAVATYRDLCEVAGLIKQEKNK
jgi:hypothetical protein